MPIAAGGFRHLTRPIIDALNVWARFLCKPVLEDRQRTLGALTRAIHRREVAERVIAELHQAGGVDVPREYVIMDRAAIGLSAVFLHLQAEVNWRRLFNDVVADFDLAALERRQTETLTRDSIGAGSRSRAGTGSSREELIHAGREAGCRAVRPGSAKTDHHDDVALGWFANAMARWRRSITSSSPSCRKSS